MGLQECLIVIVAATPWRIGALRAVRSVGPAYAWIGAVHSTVWDSLHGYSVSSPSGDVDVVYFEPGDTLREEDAPYELRLAEAEPGLRWEVVNQAGVHVWYKRAFGNAAPAVCLLEEGIATWPELATSVAVQLDAYCRVQVVTPFGLAGLFSCIVRRNPTRVSISVFRERVQAKRYTERWPQVHIIWD